MMRQTVTEHLDELRRRVLKSFLAVAIGAVISFIYVDRILEFIIEPVGSLVFTSPADVFIARIFVALVVGVLISLPFVLFQVWQFVSLGLKQDERKYVLLFGPLSVTLFFIGVVFAYLVPIPIALDFLLGFATGNIVPMITVKNYISFVGTMVLAFGVVFELPLVLVFLAKIGIATPEFLIQKRKVAIILIVILSALITPPDVITQIILAVPLIILYELGIWAIKLTIKQEYRT